MQHLQTLFRPGCGFFYPTVLDLQHFHSQEFQMKKQLQQGFTLIELMIVVAIIGILAAIAIPAYQDYIARAQVSEAFSSVSGAETTIAEYAQNNGAYPDTTTNPTSTSLGITGKYGSATVTAATGAIVYTFNKTGVNANIANGTITFTPPALAATGTTADNTFAWTCTSSIAQKYLGSVTTCKGT
jgi:type IV pilus assembly protein PilA